MGYEQAPWIRDEGPGRKLLLLGLEAISMSVSQYWPTAAYPQACASQMNLGYVRDFAVTVISTKTYQHHPQLAYAGCSSS